MTCRCLLLLLGTAAWSAGAASEAALDGDAAAARLEADDECAAAPGEAQEGRCALNALQRRGLRAASVAARREQCAPLSAPINAGCAEKVRWAAKSGKYDPSAGSWYNQIQDISGVDTKQASEQDFQRLFFCSPPGGDACGAPPCGCSRPPCDQCYQKKSQPARMGCDMAPDDNTTMIQCKPPARALDYKGMAWPTMSFPGEAEMHIFAIGDWGGMDGSLNPIEHRPPIVAYSDGKKNGPSIFPRTRWNKEHDVQLCSHKQFIECFNTHGQPPCAESCGYVAGVDDQAQMLVAKAFAARAAKVDPQFIVNVGDNFYWGGVEKTCGTPMTEISYTAHHQFDQIFERVYSGKGLDGKPWLSVLGNHDWGGRVFNNGWDQQIAYTWASDRWVMPAPYYSQRVEYPDQDFSVDFFFIDSNMMDAKDGEEDPEHNLCGEKHNAPDATCMNADGPPSLLECKDWFWDLWSEQATWLEEKMAKSDATWQIVVTHFPCGHQPKFYRKLYSKYGLDLLITGHRHDQELWTKGSRISNELGGLTCFVTGGGGGITSEATPDDSNTTDWYGEGQYGFYDLTIAKDEITIQSINWNSTVVLNATITPHAAR